MMKAVVLLLGVSIYCWFLQQGQLVAKREMGHLQSLYTDSQTQAGIILSSNR